MTIAADARAPHGRGRSRSGWSIWAAALAAVLVAVPAARTACPGRSNYPADAVVPVADWISAIMTWLKVNFTWLTRVDHRDPRRAARFRARPARQELQDRRTAPRRSTLPRLSWVGVCAAAYLAGRAFGGWRLGALVGGCFLYIALFGKWNSAMLTLALISIAVPFCIVTGLLLGIWAWRKPWAEKLIVSPALDLMQTIPTFAYLIPMLLLFGNSPVSAMIATAIFATPPMVRATMLGAVARAAPRSAISARWPAARARQKLWRVLLPSARPTLMVGVNQVIMLALNMVIIASMIGAGGLGYDVLLALRALKVGEAMEAGLAIVALAIALDRLSQAMAQQQAQGPCRISRGAELLAALSQSDAGRRSSSPRRRLLSLFIPAFADVPEGDHLHHRAVLEGGGQLGHDQLLRRHRSLPRRAAPLCAEPGARLLRRLSVARRGVPARPRRLPARRRAARRAGRAR